jgi:hypothetical protein
MKGRGYFDNVCLDERRILSWIIKTIAYEDVNWIHLAKDISLPGNCEPFKSLLSLKGGNLLG